MVPRTAYPPSVHHTNLTRHLDPATAQSHLSTFLAKTPSTPHLHPDSLLSSTGITYSAHSGPSGGLALHHLRRIEAGLRGENLGVETEEELKRQFAGEDDLAEGDDEVLDASIAATERKERKKRKRVEEIRDWVEDAAESGQVESFANTPLHRPDEDDGGMEGVKPSEWEDQQEWELKQRPLEGELGEREGAPEVRQNVQVPEVVKHDREGKRTQSLTKEEKAARKKAKKARQLERRAG